MRSFRVKFFFDVICHVLIIRRNVCDEITTHYIFASQHQYHHKDGHRIHHIHNMNTNEDEDNMDSTSKFQSVEEESKLTSNHSQNSTNNNTSEKDESFVDLVNVDDNSGNLNDRREMGTDDAIFSTQLGATSKYTSGTRKVKREIIEEGLSKSLIREATIPIEVETINTFRINCVNIRQ